MLEEIRRTLEPDEIDFVPSIALIAIVGEGWPALRVLLPRSLPRSPRRGQRAADQPGRLELNIIVGVAPDDYPAAVRAIYGAFVAQLTDAGAVSTNSESSAPNPAPHPRSHPVALSAPGSRYGPAAPSPAGSAAVPRWAVNRPTSLTSRSARCALPARITRVGSSLPAGRSRRINSQAGYSSGCRLSGARDVAIKQAVAAAFTLVLEHPLGAATFGQQAFGAVAINRAHRGRCTEHQFTLALGKAQFSQQQVAAVGQVELHALAGRQLLRHRRVHRHAMPFNKHAVAQIASQHCRVSRSVAI